MRRAKSEDVPVLIQLMDEFYAEAGYELNRAQAASAFRSLLADERLGSVWLIQSGEQDAGHLVLTFRFAMEYGGIIAAVDDLYVRPAWRNQGLGTRALLELGSAYKVEGLRALTVEVAHDNGPAQAAYRKAGFSRCDNREILALALAEPAHTV